MIDIEKKIQKQSCLTLESVWRLAQMSAKHQYVNSCIQHNPVMKTNYEIDEIISKHGYYLSSVSKLPW